MAGKEFDPFDLSTDPFASEEPSDFQAGSSSTSNWNSAADVIDENPIQSIIDAQEGDIEIEDDFGSKGSFGSLHIDDEDEPRKSRKFSAKTVVIGLCALVALGGIGGGVWFLSASTSSSATAETNVNTKDELPEFTTITGYAEQPNWVTKLGFQPTEASVLPDGKYAALGNATDGKVAIVETDTGKVVLEETDYAGSIRYVTVETAPYFAIRTSTGWTLFDGDKPFEVHSEVETQTMLTGTLVYGTDQTKPDSIFPYTSLSNAPVEAKMPGSKLAPLTFDQNEVMWGSFRDGGTLIRANYEGQETSSVILESPREGTKITRWGTVVGNFIYMVWSDEAGAGLITTHNIFDGKVVASSDFVLAENFYSPEFTQDRSMMLVMNQSLIDTNSGLIFTAPEGFSYISTYGNKLYGSTSEGRVVISMGAEAPKVTTVKNNDITASPKGIAEDESLIASTVNGVVSLPKSK